MDDKILSNILKGFCNQIFILTEKQKNGYIKTFKKQSGSLQTGFGKVSKSDFGIGKFFN
jgi:hypothetical protein